MDDREGEYRYYECKKCREREWYHEDDPMRCKYCGARKLVEPAMKTKEERERASRQAGFW